MPTQEAAGEKERDDRTEPREARLDKAISTAATAANLYALLAWLYDKPKA